MIYLLILLNFIGLVWIYFSFKDRLQPKMGKIPTNDKDYPDVNIPEFKWGDISEHYNNVIDIINLVVSENWSYELEESSSSSSPSILKFKTKELDLNVSFYVNKEGNDKFNLDPNRFTFTKGYTTLFSYSYFENKNEINIKKFIHYYYYQIKLEQRRKSESKIEKYQQELDKILINVKRDRRIDDILNFKND